MVVKGIPVVVRYPYTTVPTLPRKVWSWLRVIAACEGFLHLQTLTGSDVAANLAVLDQIEVLRCAEHIRGFGGDPENVTLFGHREGAELAQAVVATPASDGLLHKVIAQSGGYSTHSAETAQAVTDVVLEQLGLNAGDLNALGRVSNGQLAALYLSAGRRFRASLSAGYL